MEPRHDDRGGQARARHDVIAPRREWERWGDYDGPADKPPGNLGG